MVRLIAPLLPLLIMYSLVLYEKYAGIESDLRRNIALSRLTWLWLLISINTLMAHPLYKFWRELRT